VGAEAGVHVHRTILQAERVRAAVFAGETRPEFLGTEPEYADLQLRALAEVRANRGASARTLLEEAVEARPAVSGTIDGRAFAELQDADDFLGTFLEVIMRDGYRWLAMSEVGALAIAPPRTQRDLLWAQASLDLVSGESLEIFLPVLYAGSSAHADDRIRLGRMTDWVEVGSGLVRGVGQRLLLVDGEERPLLEVREIEASRPPSRTPTPPKPS